MKRSAKPMRRTAMSHGLTGVLSSSSFRRSKQPKRIKTRHKPLTKIRASARDQECTLRFPGVCNYRTDTTVLCHSNLLEDGKGYGIKAPDEKGAYGCCRCHDVLDGRARRPEGFSYDSMISLFKEAVALTRAQLRHLGLLMDD
ncbi:nuclease domain-containing protein [Collimonas sp. NPDC087041]|uniref:nuclease domain-containing protein n=1 Tax=Collimonas sp. NPDC087041 TaxID=3363960 RepID=UPI00380B9FEC